jgi:methylglutaconyl-CoA hydratase
MTMSKTPDTILVHDADGVRTLTLNRPEKRNALTPEMQDRLIALLQAAGDDAECRVVVLAGAGEAFCAGLDLKVLESDETAKAQHAADADRLAWMFRTLYECPKPTIAAVQGAAIAGGTGLATICDFTLATPQAWFGYREVRIGYVPALVSAYLALQVGEKRARDLLLSGRTFGADEAYRMGLVTEVVPRDELEDKTQSLAAALMENSPESLRATKALLAAQSRVWLDAAVAAAMVANAKSRLTADFREGVAAFREKRRPVWGKHRSISR